MKISSSKRFFFVFLAGIFHMSWASAANYDLTFTGNWRNSDDIVTGWDWTLPAEVKPARNSGIYNLNTSVPPDFPGNRLKQVNAKWSELEPKEGVYDFSSITKELNDPKYDGIMLNVRGMVVAIEDGNGKPAFQAGVTAPKWLSATAPKTKERLRAGAAVTNMHIYDPRVKSKFIKLIEKIGRSTIPGHPRLKAQVIHGVSSSRGEEWTGTQASRPAAEKAMADILVAWTKAYGSNAKKLAWLKENPVQLFNTSVVRGGTGIRGGAIETWMRYAYTPGDKSQTGQMLDANGYLSVDESFAPIAEGRTFLDENEVYESGRDTARPKSTWPYNYRMSNFRMLQMRRNIAWMERNSVINPKMLNWMSLELGQTVESTPDAWVVLMRTWIGSGTEINNFERWLYQRDINGVSTSPKLKVQHGFNAANDKSLPSNLWYANVARAEKSIGIAVDDKFLSGGQNSIAIKVTYFDSETEEWSLVYNKGGGGTAARTVKGNSTDRVRTATFFLNDFATPKSGYNFDFALESKGGNTPFMFVRVIKLEQPNAGSPPQTRPAPPGDLTFLP